VCPSTTTGRAASSLARACLELPPTPNTLPPLSPPRPESRLHTTLDPPFCTRPFIIAKTRPQNVDIMLIPGAEDTIDPGTFEQILEMDEDEVEREFSKSIVYDFFGQADSTFKKMDSSL
jgi:hypothetical protein